MPEKTSVPENVFSIDPQVLGKIFILQTAIHAIPNPESVAEFLCRGLDSIPGTSFTAVRIDSFIKFTNKGHKKEVFVKEPCDLCYKEFEELKHAGISKNGKQQEKYFCIHLQTINKIYGCILFEKNNGELLAPYQPFLENLANTVALTLENRAHENSLNQLNNELQRSRDGLEVLVQQRTGALIQKNEELINSYAEIKKAQRASHKLTEDLQSEIEVRKRTEEAKAVSESNLNALINNRNESIWSLDTNYHLIICNDFFRNAYLAAYHVKLKVGLNLIKILSPELKAYWKPKYDAALSGEKVSFEFGETIQGVRFYFNVFLNPILSNGKIIGVSALSVDITERKQAEEKLRTSEAYNRLLFETSPIGLALCRMDGSLVDVNPAYAKILGRTVEETLKLSYWDITPEKYAQQEAEQLKNLKETGVYGPFEKEYIHKDGALIPARLQGLIFTQEGERFIWSSVEDITERRKAEDKLIESEEKFQAIFKTAPGSMILSSLPDGKTIEVNDNFFRITGYSREEALGKNTADLKMWADSDARIHFLSKLQTDGLVRNFEADLNHKSGAIRNGLVSGQIITVQGKKYLVSTFYDITERKRAEEKLQRNEQLLRLFIENTPAAIAMFDREMKYIVASRRYLTDYDLGKPEVIGRSHYEILPEIPERWKEIHRRCLAGATERAEEDPFPRASGKLDWVRWEIRPWYERRGEIGGIILFSEVITERKCVEDELKRRNEELTALNILGRRISQSLSLEEVVSDAVKELSAAIDNETAFLFLRDGEKLNLVGCESKDASFALAEIPEHRVGQCICGLAVSEGKPLYSANIFTDLRCSWKECKRAGFRSFAALPLRTGEEIIGVVGLASKEERDFESRSGFLETIASQVTSGIRNARLFTEVQRHAQELENRVKERTLELQVKNTELEAFTYSVSHDLKTPLRGIDSYSLLLLEDHADRLDEEGRAFLKNIRSASLHMRHLIDDLLAYSRLERRHFSQEKVNLSALVNGLLAERGDEVLKRGVKITVQLPSRAVTADPDGLSMVLRNLIDNALKFTAQVAKPAVEIGGREEEKICNIWVKDNGIGFDMRHYPQIFDIFQRLQTQEEFPGTGIGLAIVKKAMERMGGKVWGESVPGKGATFYLEVPK
ncbi:MAG: integral membrane sensor signal transduction histidine kinase [Chloroflexi bacterium]|nr:MAG: integral membrane sensor signal transduction histidine kinase [Chloroflexota bacterium]MBA4375738.1 hypothetical protein [Anaerolinea sp.]